MFAALDVAEQEAILHPFCIPHLRIKVEFVEKQQSSKEDLSQRKEVNETETCETKNSLSLTAASQDQDQFQYQIESQPNNNNNIMERSYSESNMNLDEKCENEIQKPIDNNIEAVIEVANKLNTNDFGELENYDLKMEKLIETSKFNVIGSESDSDNEFDLKMHLDEITSNKVEKSEENIVNEECSDPLHFSEWPNFIWQRTQVLQPLPSAGHLNQIAKKENTVILIVIHNCFHIRKNLCLEMAFWLSKKIKIPLVALVFLSSDTINDVNEANQDKSVRQKLDDNDNKNSSLMFKKKKSCGRRSFERKSIYYLSKLNAMQKALASFDIPLLGCYTEKHFQPSEVINRTIVQLQKRFNILSLFTDDSCHPYHESCLSIIHRQFPNIPVILVDCDNVIPPRHTTMLASKSKNIANVNKSFISQEYKGFVEMFRTELIRGIEEVEEITANSDFRDIQMKLLDGKSDWKYLESKILGKKNMSNQQFDASIVFVDWKQVEKCIEKSVIIMTRELEERIELEDKSNSKKYSPIVTEMRMRQFHFIRYEDKRVKSLLHFIVKMVKLLDPVFFFRSSSSSSSSSSSNDYSLGERFKFLHERSEEHSHQHILHVFNDFLLAGVVQVKLFLYQLLQCLDISIASVENIPFSFESQQYFDFGTPLNYNYERFGFKTEAQYSFVHSIFQICCETEFSKCRLYHHQFHHSMLSEITFPYQMPLKDVPWLHLINEEALKEIKNIETILGLMCIIPKAAEINLNTTNGVGSAEIQNQSIRYPHEIRTGQTVNRAFNSVQLQLVRNGIVPIHCWSDLYICFLMLNLPTPLLGIKTAVIEICTHARVDVLFSPSLLPNFLHRMLSSSLPLLLTCLNQFGDKEPQNQFHLVKQKLMLQIEESIRQKVGHASFERWIFDGANV